MSYSACVCCVQEFIELACQSQAVVCCRCSPTHKAQVVRLLQEHSKRPVCAVGECSYASHVTSHTYTKFEITSGHRPFSVRFIKAADHIAPWSVTGAKRSCVRVARDSPVL